MRGAKRLKVLAQHTALQIPLLHQTLNVHRNARLVGAHELLELLTLLLQANLAARLAEDVQSGLFLKQARHLVTNGQIKVATTYQLVSRGQHAELAFNKFGAAELHTRVAHVHKDNTARLFTGRRQVLLVDAVGQRHCRCLVKEAEAVEPSHFAGVKHGVALLVIKVYGHAHYTVLYFGLERCTAAVAQVAQEARGHLSRLVCVILAVKLDDNADLPIGRGSVAIVGLGQPRLHIGISILASNEGLEGFNRVLKIGDALQLGTLAKIALLLAIGHERGGLAPTIVVQKHLNTSATRSRENRCLVPNINANHRHDDVYLWMYFTSVFCMCARARQLC